MAKRSDAGHRIAGRDLTSWRTRFGRWLARLAQALAHRFSANVVLSLTAGVGLALAAALVAVGAEVYDAVEDGDGIARLDRPVLNAAIALRTPTNERVVTWFTDLGGPVVMPVLATVVTAVLVLCWRSVTPAVLMALAVAGSLTMTAVGKAVVGRVRPPLADAVPPYEYAASFPSGHALNSTVIAGLVAYLVLPRLSTLAGRILAVGLAAAWAVSMGLSRIFLGHHWMTDVCFAWAVGLAWLALVVTAHRLFLTARSTERIPRGDEH